MDLLHVTIFSCNPKCNASKHYLFYNLHIHESLPYLRDFVCVCVCVCGHKRACARMCAQVCKCFSTKWCVTRACTQNKNTDNMKAFAPVSVSKLTVAWNLFPCFSMSRVRETSRLSRFSWIRWRALSRFSQKLISCNAVPDEGSRSSFVTCFVKIRINKKRFHYQSSRFIRYLRVYLC